MAGTAVETTAPQRAHVAHEGFTVSSNEGTADDLRRDLGVDAEPVTDADPGDEDPEAAVVADKPTGKLKADEQVDRIQKLTFEREEAKREAAAEKAENARLKAERERPRTEPEPEPRRTDDEQAKYDAWKRGEDANDPKPRLEQFEDHDAYLDARDAHAERRFERKAERAQQERQHQQRHAAMQEAGIKFQTRMDAEVAKDPAFKEILSRVQIPQGPILDVFLSTDIPEAMARHLDAHPEELRAMVAMRPGHQLAAIKKLEGRLEAHVEFQASSKAAPAGPAAVTKPTTKAHPPISPVVGSHVAASDEPPGDDATDEAWFAYEEKQQKAARKR